MQIPSIHLHGSRDLLSKAEETFETQCSLDHFTPNFNVVSVYQTNYLQTEIHETGYFDMPRRTIFLSFPGSDQAEDKPSPQPQTEQEGLQTIYAVHDPERKRD